MIQVFVDTVYWVAIANPRDQWHQASCEAWNNLNNLEEVELVTTDSVLIEVLTSLRQESSLRSKAVKLVRDIKTDPNIIVVAQTKDLFRDALDFYEQRDDKSYSFTDCISMVVMKKHKINKILTSDNHFNQEKFQTLIKKAD